MALEIARKVWEIQYIEVCIHTQARFILKMITQSLYVAAEEMAPQSGRLVSLAAASPSGAWFYAEVTDIDGSQCSAFVQDFVLPQLRKVTDTTFVKSADLGAALADWIERTAPGDAGQIEIRTQEAGALDVQFLRELLQGHDAVASRLRAGECSVDRVSLELGLARCGGPNKVGANAIVRAVLAAVCDEKRNEPIGALNTRRFELLMGTRNSTSLRAWIRRHEQQRQLAHMRETSAPGKEARENKDRIALDQLAGAAV